MPSNPPQSNDDTVVRTAQGQNSLFRALQFTPFNLRVVPAETTLHPDLKEEVTFFTNSKNFFLVIGAAAFLLVLEYLVGSGGNFAWVASGAILVAFILPLRAWAEHLWRKYASWVYRTAPPVDAEAYFYMTCPDRHHQLLNIIYLDGFKETVSVRTSRYDASKLLDQKKPVKVRRDYASGGAAIIVDCQGKLYWCSPA